MTKHVNHTMRLIQRAGGLPANILGSAGDLSSHTSHIGIANCSASAFNFLDSACKALAFNASNDSE